MDGRRTHIYTRGAAEGVNLSYASCTRTTMCTRMYVHTCVCVCVYTYTHMCCVGVREAADKYDDTTSHLRTDPSAFGRCRGVIHFRHNYNTYTYTYMYTLCVHIHTYTATHMCMYVYTHTHTHTHVYTHVYVYAHTRHMYTHVYMYTCVRTHTLDTYTCTHVHAYIGSEQGSGDSNSGWNYSSSGIMW